MADTGPLSPSFVATDAEGGTENWSDPTNVIADDGAYAVAQLSANEISYFLVCGEFGAAVPDEATVDGLRFTVEITLTGAANASELYVRTLNDFSSNAGPVALSNGDNIFGGPADDFGLTLTPAEVNTTDFRFYFRAQESAGSSCDVSIDKIRAEIFYSEGGTPGKASILLGL